MTDKEIVERWLKGRLADLYEESQCEVPELPKEVIEGQMLVLRETLSFIDSLPAQEKGPLSEDLEEAAKHNTFKYVFDKNVKETLISELKYIGNNSFKDGAKWQKEKDADAIDISHKVALKSCAMIRQQTIQKACEWLDRNAVKYLITDTILGVKMTGLHASMTEDFKKYMED